MYSIIGIDGIDGAGKSTVAQFIKERLIMMGYHVVTIEPPFYDTPSGKIVEDYLRHGYDDIRDRMVASMLYSFDRTMWMKENFGSTFINPENYFEYTKDQKLIVLYTRNWLSNIFFQTTPIAQTPVDSYRVMGHVFGTVLNEDGEEIRLTLPRMHEILQELRVCGGVSEHYNIRNFKSIRTIQTLYRRQRALFVKNMMRDVYMMDIMPWHACLPEAVVEERYPKTLHYFNEVDFVQAAESVCNIVLAPHMANTSVDILRQNMIRRYKGDETKMDRNEANREYLDSVLENIHYIHRNFDRIMSTKATHNITFHDANLSSAEEDDALSLSSLLLEKAYRYHIIHTTDEASGQQLDFGRITNEIMGYLQMAIPHFGIQH